MIGRAHPCPLTEVPSIAVISDRVEHVGAPGDHRRWTVAADAERPWPRGETVEQPVTGGYLERLPLACVAAGIVEQAEVWHHRVGGSPWYCRNGPRLAYRSFAIEAPVPPFANDDMLAFVQAFGAPHVLVVYGLGVSSELLAACGASVIVYNSIDAPTWRVPAEVSAHFDIVLTGAQWQSDEARARHPNVLADILPVGPEFAAVDLFHPLDTPKDYDLVYVAAAQPYKRHDILFDALDRLPRDMRALCVFGYGEDADALRETAARRGLSIDFVGPPGVPFEEVNRLMNRARFGVVCGRDDGAPAILTEYMLAGLPVLANAELACGRQYILPETGMLAAPADFAEAIGRMRETAGLFRPRETVLARWSWPHSVEKLAGLVARARAQKSHRVDLDQLSGLSARPNFALQ